MPGIGEINVFKKTLTVITICKLMKFVFLFCTILFIKYFATNEHAYLTRNIEILLGSSLKELLISWGCHIGLEIVGLYGVLYQNIYMLVTYGLMIFTYTLSVLKNGPSFEVVSGIVTSYCAYRLIA
jgi:hypothetical protein